MPDRRREILPGHAHRTGGRIDQANRAAQQRRFAAAVVPEDDEQLAWRDMQADVVERASPAGVVFGEPIDLENWTQRDGWQASRAGVAPHYPGGINRHKLSRSTFSVDTRLRISSKALSSSATRWVPAMATSDLNMSCTSCGSVEKSKANRVALIFAL